MGTKSIAVWAAEECVTKRQKLMHECNGSITIVTGHPTSNSIPELFVMTVSDIRTRDGSFTPQVTIQSPVPNTSSFASWDSLKDNNTHGDHQNSSVSRKPLEYLTQQVQIGDGVWGYVYKGLYQPPNGTEKSVVAV